MKTTELREELRCSICLNTFRDPVTMKCGHNFCRGCIEHFLNTQVKSQRYFCPECRTNFHSRPTQQRNISLHKIAERFRSTQPPQKEVTGICCTYCVDSLVPAVKSCLLCEASLCKKHLKVHSKEAEHVLTDPSTSLEDRKCSVHKKVLEYYCTKDSAYICASCSLIGEHRGHEIQSLEETLEKKKEEMRNVLQTMITKREETEERVQSLEERKRKFHALFTHLRKQAGDQEMKVLDEISRQEEQVSLSLSDMAQKLGIKKDELSRKMRHIEELCNMTDPLTVLQDPDTGDLCDPEEGDRGGLEKIHEVDVDVISGMLHAGFSEIMTYLQTILAPKPENKRKRRRRNPSPSSHTQASSVSGAGEGGIYGQGPTDILLDVNTADNNLLISENEQTVTWTNITQKRAKTAKRFQFPLVMSSSSFTSGRHYWDMEFSSSGVWAVGVCYPSIDRRGGQSHIGYNKKSWCLWGGEVYNYECSVIHDGKENQLPHQICSDKVRICLDYEAGQLSFYEIRDTIIPIHTFTATFTEPLHAAFYVCEGSIKILGEAALRNQRPRRHQPRHW